ncbi:MAG: Dabb family protein [Flavobacterium sp.]|nr:Dabb family protein [Pedobacter sp.]
MISQSSSSQGQIKNAVQKQFVHTVYFWLKHPDNQDEKAKFETSIKKFINNSIHIQTKHLGVPADTNRPVIDRSYTYCLSLTFASKADQDKYQDEVLHKIFIKESEMLWEKVIVYDSVNIL